MLAPALSPAFLQLRGRLHEVFGFHNHDLDFGIYRVLRLKRKEITRFIDEVLPRTVQEALAQVRDTQLGHRLDALVSFVSEEGGKNEKAWLNDPIANATELAEYIRYKRPDNADKLLAVLAEATAAEADNQAEATETRVYNHLLAFVERYYRDGDFGYNDRSLATYRVDYPEADQGTAALPATQAPYDGRDVLFHWKHRDSYYIKTGGSFGAVAFALDGVDMPGHAMELWLEAEAQDAGGVAQNNNRDTGKHFRFERIEPRTEPLPDGTSRTVHRAVFRLTLNASTPKAELYSRLLAEVFGDTDTAIPAWLRSMPAKGETEGKSLFNDIDNQYDKVQEGTVRGIGSLRLDVSKYLEALAKNPAFASLGKNGSARVEALSTDLRTRRLLLLDQRFNAFIAGTDHDYFIHKNLDGFLHHEQRRYLQDVLLGDLDTLLAGQPNSAALVQARAFRSVTDALIELLSSVEEFQKSLFLRRKLVVDTRWLCSVGKLQASGAEAVVLAGLWEDILHNQTQLDEWRSTFGVSIADPLQLLQHPTLVLDTRHFTIEEYPHFQDRLLACFSNLEAATDGILLNSENFQALNLLKERYRGRLPVIYIDPPYNTGGDGFLYKDRFRHSSWLSMMQDRLLEAKELLSQEGIIMVSIGREEVFHLQILLDQIFEPENRLGDLTWEKGRKNDAKFFSLGHDYVLVYARDKAYLESKRTVWREEKPGAQEILDEYRRLKRTFDTDTVKIQEGIREFYASLPAKHPALKHKRYNRVDDNGIWRDGDISWPKQDGGPKYVIKHPTTNLVCDTPEVGWRFATEDKFWLYHRNGFIEFRDAPQTPMLKRYLNYVSTDFDPDSRQKKLVTSDSEEDEVNVQVMPSVFYRSQQPATKHLRHVLGKVEFENPKDPEVLERLIRYTNEQGGVCLDFFGGTGTTAESVLSLQRKPGQSRKFILVEQGDYFDKILLERIRRVMYSHEWKDTRPVGAEGNQSLVQVLKLEQYEDVLNALEVDHSEVERPEGVGVRYLFRPEEQRARTSLDLSKPFAQSALYGRQRQAVPADLLESYIWLVGLVPRQRGHLLVDSHLYRWVRSGVHLVVFRDVMTGQSDDEALRLVLAAARAAAPGTADITTLHVNQEADYLTPPEPGLTVRAVTANDFDRGANWSAS